MDVVAILLGLLFISSGKLGVKRGRGGKTTRNGLIAWLFGVFLLLSGIYSLLGFVGSIIAGVLMTCYWVARDTGLIEKAIDKIRMQQEPKKYRDSQKDKDTETADDEY